MNRRFTGRREGIQVVDIRHQSEFAPARVSNPGFGGQRERRLDLREDLIGRPLTVGGIRGGLQRDGGRPAVVLIARVITDTGSPSRPHADRGPSHGDRQQDRGGDLQPGHSRRAQNRVYQSEG